MYKKHLLGAAATAAALFAAPAFANAATTCSYDPPTGIASLQHSGGGAIELDNLSGTLTWFNGTGGSGNCTAPDGQMAFSHNTSSVLFTGTPGLPDDFIVSEFGGNFLGGRTGGADPTQIEISVFPGAEDTVDVIGSRSRDIIAPTGGGGNGGVSLDAFSNPRRGIKFIGGDPGLTRIHGEGGDDLIWANGTFAPAASMHLELHGDDGNDGINGGMRFGDTLFGETGDDAMRTDDAQPGDIMTGGAGTDTGVLDARDSASGVEKLSLGTVGKLDLPKPAVHLDAHGAGRITMGWQHPRSWKQLRTITIAAMDGAREIGKITLHPKAGTATAGGALRLRAGANLTHKGKWARADLPIALETKLDGPLRLDIAATDTHGKRQLDAGSGALL